MAMIYSWAIRRRLLRYTPFVKLEKPFVEQRRSRTFTNDELRRLFVALQHAPKQIAGLLAHAVLYGQAASRDAEDGMVVDRPREEAPCSSRCDHEEPPGTPGAVGPGACKLLDMLKSLSGESPHVFPGPNGGALNWVQRACASVMHGAGIENGRHHDTRRVLQALTPAF